MSLDMVLISTNMRKIYEVISNPASNPAQRAGANRLLTLMTERYQRMAKDYCR